MGEVKSEERSMTNNRQKGKRIERKLATILRPMFPNVRRNAGIQAQSGGVDLEETGCFDFEVKGGHAYKSKMIRDVLEQTKSEGKAGNYKVAVMFPDREEPYVMIPLDDFMEMLQVMKKEEII